MNGLVSINFEAFAEYIDLASGNSDVFAKLLLGRNDGYSNFVITDKNKPCFYFYANSPQPIVMNDFLETYSEELELRM